MYNKNMEEIKLTEKEKRDLDHLKNLLDFMSNEIKTKIVKGYKHTHLQNFLTYSFVYVHNMSEAIYVLCKDLRPHAAQSLLRNIFEALAHIEYIKSSDTEKRLALFAKDGFSKRIPAINNMKEVDQKYPNLKDKSGAVKASTEPSLTDFVNNHIRGIESGNNLLPEDIYPKTIPEIIKALDKEGPESVKGMNELNYNLVYRQLSSYTHMSAWGLGNFINEKDGEIIFDLGQHEEVDHIIGLLYLYYFGVANYLYDEKVLEGKMPHIYQVWCDEFKSENNK